MCAKLEFFATPIHRLSGQYLQQSRSYQGQLSLHVPKIIVEKYTSKSFHIANTECCISCCNSRYISLKNRLFEVIITLAVMPSLPAHEKKNTIRRAMQIAVGLASLHLRAKCTRLRRTSTPRPPKRERSGEMEWRLRTTDQRQCVCESAYRVRMCYSVRAPNSRIHGTHTHTHKHLWSKP